MSPVTTKKEMDLSASSFLLQCGNARARVCGCFPEDTQRQRTIRWIIDVAVQLHNREMYDALRTNYFNLYQEYTVENEVNRIENMLQICVH